jgi:hypothetical protein
MGMRYAKPLIDSLLQGVLAMEESVTYQAMLRQGMDKGIAKGKAEEARRILFLVGREQLGEPDADTTAALEALTDVERLEAMHLRLRQVSSWQELLGLQN